MTSADKAPTDAFMSNQVSAFCPYCPMDCICKYADIQTDTYACYSASELDLFAEDSSLHNLRPKYRTPYVPGHEHPGLSDTAREVLTVNSILMFVNGRLDSLKTLLSETAASLNTTLFLIWFMGQPFRVRIQVCPEGPCLYSNVSGPPVFIPH